MKEKALAEIKYLESCIERDQKDLDKAVADFKETVQQYNFNDICTFVKGMVDDIDHRRADIAKETEKLRMLRYIIGEED